MTRVLIVAVMVILGVGALFLALRPETTASSDEPRERAFDVSIAEGEMDPREVSVVEGDSVTLSVSAEEPVEVHVHGYDIEEEVEPDEPARISFDADLTGRFDIEDHETEAVIGTLVVRPR
jgi:endonuclease YncB( thermonuclease family)